MQYKTCTTCNKNKPIINFYKSKQKRFADGFTDMCKACKSIINKNSRDKLKQNNPTDYQNKRKEHRKKFKDRHGTKLKTYSKRKHYKRTYGISLDEYNEKLRKQNYVCFICRESNISNRNLAVDHCHKTGKIRNLLCNKCNLALGAVSDDVGILKNMIDYLNKWNKSPIILGIHGRPRSGKDTICNFILKGIPLLRYGPSVQVKKAAAAMFNVPEEYFYDDKKKEEIDEYWKISYREMAQKVGNESSRKIFGEDFWMRHVDYFLYHKLPEDKEGIILADIRYANEVEWVKERGGFVMFVTRDNRSYVANEGHDAERGLPESLADIVIRNNGSFEDLHTNIKLALSTQGIHL